MSYDVTLSQTSCAEFVCSRAECYGFLDFYPTCTNLFNLDAIKINEEFLSRNAQCRESLLENSSFRRQYCTRERVDSDIELLRYSCTNNDKVIKSSIRWNRVRIRTLLASYLPQLTGDNIFSQALGLGKFYELMGQYAPRGPGLLEVENPVEFTSLPLFKLMPAVATLYLNRRGTIFINSDTHGSDISRISDSFIVSSDLYAGNVIARSFVKSADCRNCEFRLASITASSCLNSYASNSNISSCVLENTSIVDSHSAECRLTGSRITNGRLNSATIINTSLNNCTISFITAHDVVLEEFTCFDQVTFDRSQGHKDKKLSTFVHDYCNKDACRLKSFGSKDFICGIELEVIPKEPILYKPMYCRVKNDGSLSIGGVEIVTRPDSIDVHLRNLKRMLVLSKISVDSTCGMHIHVSKASANVNHIRERIYRRLAKYYKIAGRVENRYCIYNTDGGRYQAVGLNSDTIEFRLFSGTTSIHKIKRRLQWVRAICAWSKTIKPVQRKTAVNYTNYNIDIGYNFFLNNLSNDWRPESEG